MGPRHQHGWGDVKNLLQFVARRKMFDLHEEKQLGWGEGFELLSLKM